jgi:hypothetical protein
VNKLLVIPLVAGLLLGCAQMVWNKPNAQQGEFERTRYTCLRQSQQYQSGIGMVTPNNLTGGYTVIDTSGMETNSNLFNACMQANGWFLQQVGQERQYENTQILRNQSQVIEKCESEGNKRGTNAFGECYRKYIK